MRTLSNGPRPDGEEPDPKRRRTRRPGNKSGRERGTNAHSDDRVAESAAKGNPHVNTQRGSRDGTHGSTPLNGGDGSQHAQVAKPEAHDHSVPSPGQGKYGPSKKKHRRSRRHNSGKHARAEQADTHHGSHKNRHDTESGSHYKKGGFNRYDQRRRADHGQTGRHGRRGRHAGSAPLYAALDLGTNNCRLLIAVPQDRGRFRVIDGFSRIVRLGEGLEHSGRLSDEAMDRAIGALKICAGKLAHKNIRRQRLIATEACRQASNGDFFLERVVAETGLDLEVVDRQTEARLAAEGCGSLMDRKADGAVLFDIGGGSSELVLVDSSDKNRRHRRISDRIVAWTSLPMGVVTLAERFGGRDVTRSLFDEMVADVMQHIDEFTGRSALENAFTSGKIHLLGTSGTVTTLAGIHLELPRYDRRQVDGIWLKDEDIDKVIDRLLEMPFSERAKNPCIGEERADLVLAGCAILNAIRKTWPTDRLRVADRGLREGLLAEMMSKDQVWSRGRRRRRKMPPTDKSNSSNPGSGGQS